MPKVYYKYIYNHITLEYMLNQYYGCLVTIVNQCCSKRIFQKKRNFIECYSKYYYLFIKKHVRFCIHPYMKKQVNDNVNHFSLKIKKVHHLHVFHIYFSKNKKMVSHSECYSPLLGK